jgi:glucose dehydrogenase
VTNPLEQASDNLAANPELLAEMLLSDMSGVPEDGFDMADADVAMNAHILNPDSTNRLTDGSDYLAQNPEFAQALSADADEDAVAGGIEEFLDAE